MIEVVWCKNNEGINFVSVFHHHVTLHIVWIWLRNQLVKLPWNRNKILCYRCLAWNIKFDMDNLSQTDMILLKHRFIQHNFHRDAWWNLWSSGSYGYFLQSTKWRPPWCIGEDGVIFLFLAATKQLYEWFSPSVRPSVRPSVCLSVCLSHLFDYVPIILSSWNFQELLPVTKVTSMQKVKVKGQGHRGHNPT